MTEFLRKSFSVSGPRKVDARRDCAKLGHWPRLNRRGAYECVFCQAPCQVDGTDAMEESK